jgi:hypothetical protein
VCVCVCSNGWRLGDACVRVDKTNTSVADVLHLQILPLTKKLVNKDSRVIKKQTPEKNFRLVQVSYYPLHVKTKQADR